MKMRTIAGAADHFRQLDEGTAITAYAIRRAILSGAVPHTRAGAKYLVAVENLEEYFAGGAPQEQTQQTGIRAVGN